MALPGWVNALLHYSSVRYVMVQDIRLGLIFRILQFGIIGYVVGYSIIAQKSYQRTDPVQGASTIKIKGSAYSNHSGEITVYDSSDLIVPPIMEGAFFVATRLENMFQTRDQLCSISEDFTSNSGQECKTDADCTEGEMTYYGLMNGKCDTSVKVPNGTSHYCTIRSWCPLEKDPDFNPDSVLSGIEDFSVFIRTNIQFPTFDITRSTGKIPEKGKTLFLLKDMVDLSSNTNISEFGAVVLAKAKFDCDTDEGTSDCNPEWSFDQIDEGTGFNYRKVQYANSNQTERVLTKLYGVRVVITIFGKAGQFYIVNLLVALGAGLGLLGVASITADFILQNCWPKREKFLHDKFCTVDLEVPETPTVNALLFEEQKGGGDDYALMKDSKIDHKTPLRSQGSTVTGPVPNPLLEALGDEDVVEDKKTEETGLF